MLSAKSKNHFFHFEIFLIARYTPKIELFGKNFGNL
jgi:hypothetical protein